MEKRAEIRMKAASNYYMRRWGEPVPPMTHRFAEHVIARWQEDAKKGIVAIPVADHGGRPTDPTRRFDLGGLTLELKPNQLALGSKGQVYRGKSQFEIEAEPKNTTVQTESGEKQTPQAPTARSIRHERQGNQDRNIFDAGGLGTGLDLRDPNEHIGV